MGCRFRNRSPPRLRLKKQSLEHEKGGPTDRPGKNPINLRQFSRDRLKRRDIIPYGSAMASLSGKRYFFQEIFELGKIDHRSSSIQGPRITISAGTGTKNPEPGHGPATILRPLRRYGVSATFLVLRRPLRCSSIHSPLNAMIFIIVCCLMQSHPPGR